MTLGLRITLVFAIFSVAFYGVDECSYMFNHPWYPGEVAVSIIAAFWIIILTMISARLLLFWPKPKKEDK